MEHLSFSLAEGKLHVEEYGNRYKDGHRGRPREARSERLFRFPTEVDTMICWAAQAAVFDRHSEKINSIDSHR